jgi:hypothetical protein
VHRWLLVCLLIVAAACRPGPAPVSQLPRCGPPPSPRGTAVSGLVLPAAAIVTDVQPEEAVTSVQAYLPRTPVQLRQFYDEQPGLDVIAAEGDARRTEVLYQLRQARVYVAARAVCGEASRVFAVVGSAGAPERIPTPGSDA